MKTEWTINILGSSQDNFRAHVQRPSFWIRQATAVKTAHCHAHLAFLPAVHAKSAHILCQPFPIQYKIRMPMVMVPLVQSQQPTVPSVTLSAREIVQHPKMVSDANNAWKERLLFLWEIHSLHLAPAWLCTHAWNAQLNSALIACCWLDPTPQHASNAREISCYKLIILQEHPYNHAWGIVSIVRLFVHATLRKPCLPWTALAAQIPSTS